jgi:hypothetical protein
MSVALMDIKNTYMGCWRLADEMYSRRSKMKHQIMPGMLLVGMGRIARICIEDGYMYVTHPDSIVSHRVEFTPDMVIRLDVNDQATVGCLLALVRQAWGDPGIYAEGQYSQGRYMYRVRGGHGHGAGFNRATEEWHLTEAAALVATLEAAP